MSDRGAIATLTRCESPWNDESNCASVDTLSPTVVTRRIRKSFFAVDETVSVLERPTLSFRRFPKLSEEGELTSGAWTVQYTEYAQSRWAAPEVTTLMALVATPGRAAPRSSALSRPPNPTDSL